MRQRNRVHHGIPVRCEGCGQEIEYCDGRYGQWMHSATRREVDGHLAVPETPEAFDARRQVQRVKASM